MIPPATISEIVERAPIVEIIGRDVKLKRAGREWRGLSPFKAERTASFFVNDYKHRFFDFSSGLNGTVIKFLMQLHRMTFPEACESLAGEIGMALDGKAATAQDTASKALKHEVQAAVDSAQAFFVQQLRASATACAYAGQRGLTDETLDALGVGFAPPEPFVLRNHLDRFTFSKEAIAASGLFVKDTAFLRDRMLFPIQDRRGLIVSFGGRALGNAEPKYLNGRESLLYQKGRTLYNLARAEKAIRSLGSAIVMEGYMDVAMAWQSGVANAVASCGTALSLEQAWLLWRQAPQVYLCLDDDAAGDRASAAMLDTAMPALAGDRRLAFVHLTGGMDPDDYLRTAGRGSFDGLVRNAESCPDRLWRRIEEQLEGAPADKEARARTLARDLTRDIADEELRQTYRKTLWDRAWALGKGLATTLAARVGLPAGGPPVREAAIAYAVATERRYAEDACEALAELRFTSPLAAQVVKLALGCAADEKPFPALDRELALLRSAIAAPLPSYLIGFDAEAFRGTLELHADVERRRALRAMLPAAAARD